MTRGLSRGEGALVVVVATLVVVFLAMLAGRIGTGTGTGTTAPATGTAAAPTTPAVSDVVDLAGVEWDFRLPSGNIGCVMDGDGVVCAIATFEYTPPTLAGCTGETGFAFRLDSRGTSPLCTTGTADLAGAPELPYGEVAEDGEFTCTSSETGVSCRNAIGHEITLRRGSYGL